jgi:hypothetical protein
VRPAEATGLSYNVGTVTGAKAGTLVAVPVENTSGPVSLGGIQSVVSFAALPLGQPLPTLKSVSPGTALSDRTSVDLNQATCEFMVAWPRGAQIGNGVFLNLNLQIPGNAGPGTRYTVTIRPRFAVTTTYEAVPTSASPGSVTLEGTPPAPINEPPTITSLQFASPLAMDGARPLVKGSQDVAIVCADSDGQVRSLQLLVDGSVVAETPAPTGTTDLENAVLPLRTDTLTEGWHALTAAATDDLGAKGTSDPVSFVVDRSAPVVTLAEPVSGQSYKGNLNLKGNVTDAHFHHYDVGVKEPGASDWVPVATGVNVPLPGPTPMVMATYRVAGKPDGVYSFRVVAVDKLGTSAQAEITNVLLDNTAPSVVLSGIQPGALLSARTNLSISASDANGVRDVRAYLDGSASPFITQSGGTATASLDPERMTDGDHTVVVRASDPAGNLGEASIGLAVRTAPMVRFLTPEDGATITSSPIRCSLRVEARSGVASVDIYGSASESAEPPASSLLAHLSPPLTDSASLDATRIPSGPTGLLAVVTDAAGQKARDWISITNRAKADLIAMLEAPTGRLLRSRPLVHGVLPIKGSSYSVPASAFDHYELSYLGPNDPSTTAGTPISRGDRPVTRGVLGRWDTSALSADGTYNLRLVTVSKTGTSETSTLAVVVDNHGPEITVQAPSEGATVRGSVSLQMSAADPSDVVRLQGGFRGAEAVASGHSVSSLGIHDGPATLEFEAEDGLGNIARKRISVTVSNVQAEASISKPAQGARISPFLLGTTACPVVAEVHGLAQWQMVLTSGRTFSQVVAEGDGEQSGPVANARVSNPRSVPDGAGTLRIRGRRFGNSPTDTLASVPITLDGTGVAVRITSPSENESIRAATPLVFSYVGDSSDLASVTAKVDGDTPLTKQGDFAFTLDPSGLGTGRHLAEVTTLDTAGNTSSASLPFFVPRNVDRADLTSPTEGSFVRGMVELKGVVSVSVNTLGLTFDGPQKGTIPIPAPQSFPTRLLAEWDTSALPDGLYTLSLGRNGAEPLDTLTLGVDNHKPELRLDSLAASGDATGMVRDANLSSYRLDAMTRDGAVKLATGTQNVDGLLAHLDAARLAGVSALRLSATDKAGNTNSVEQAIQVDTSAPTILLTPADGDFPTNLSTDLAQVSFHVGGTITDSGAGLASVLVKVNGAEVKRVEGLGGATVYALDLATQVPAAGLTPDTPIVLEVTATDAAGNQGKESHKLYFAPGAMAKIVSPLGGGIVRNGQPVIGTVSGPGILSWSLEMSLDGGFHDAVSLRTDVQTGDSLLPSNEEVGKVTSRDGQVPDGPIFLRLWAFGGDDQSTAVATDTVQVVLDTVAPTLRVLDSRTADEALPVAGDFRIQVETEDAHPGNTSIYVDSQADPSEALPSAGNLTFPLSTQALGLTPGVHALRVVSEDAAGNSTEALTYVQVLDSDLELAFLRPSSNGAALRGTARITLTADGAAGPLSLSLEARSLDSNRAAIALTPSGTPATGYDLYWDTTQVPNGHYELLATGVAGATSAVARRDVVIDNAAPTVVLLSPAYGATLAGVVDIVGTVEDANLADYSVEWCDLSQPRKSWIRIPDGLGDRPVQNGVLARWDTTVLPREAYRDIALRVVARDQAGNASLAASFSLIILNSPSTDSLSLSFVQPKDGGRVTENTLLRLLPSGGDPGTPTTVTLYDNRFAGGLAPAAVLRSPYLATLHLDAGRHTLRAVASGRDSSGRRITAEASVTVVVETRPATAVITSPTSGATVTGITPVVGLANSQETQNEENSLAAAEGRAAVNTFGGYFLEVADGGSPADFVQIGSYVTEPTGSTPAVLGTLDPTQLPRSSRRLGSGGDFIYILRLTVQTAAQRALSVGNVRLGVRTEIPVKVHFPGR